VNADQLAEAQAIAPVVCVQNMYNIGRRADDALVDATAEQGIAFVPYFPLGGFNPLQSGALGGGRGAARHHPAGHRAGLAAAPLAEHPADPGYVVGGAPAGERRRGRAGHHRRGRRAGRDRRVGLSGRAAR
jgi:aryl-alcohol dehydrogenase-like predicted oxidoreductase